MKTKPNRFEPLGWFYIDDKPELMIRRKGKWVDVEKIKSRKKSKPNPDYVDSEPIGFIWTLKRKSNAIHKKK